MSLITKQQTKFKSANHLKIFQIFSCWVLSFPIHAVIRQRHIIAQCGEIVNTTGYQKCSLLPAEQCTFISPDFIKRWLESRLVFSNEGNMFSSTHHHQTNNQHGQQPAGAQPAEAGGGAEPGLAAGPGRLLRVPPALVPAPGAPARHLARYSQVSAGCPL